MIRQPGLHNKEDIQANNFPLSSSELDVFHGFFQGCCQGLFAPLTSSVLKGSGSRQRCKCPECHQPCLETPGRTTASGFGLCSCQVSLPPLKEDDSTECRRFKQQGRKKKKEQNLTSITSDQALACKHISNMLKGKPDKDAWDAVSPFLPQHELTFTWLSTTNHPHAQGSLPSPAHPSASPALLNPPPQHHKEWKHSPSHREWLKGCPRALHVLSQAGWAGGGPHCSPHKISLRKISHPLMLRKNCTKFLIKEGKLTETMLACRLSLNQALFVRCIFYIERAPNRKASKHKAHLQLLHFPLHTLPPHHWSGHEAKAKTTESHSILTRTPPTGEWL